MARFLVYTSPARGHLYPVVDTLLELRRRGHSVHVLTLGSEVEVLHALGMEADAVHASIEHTPLDTWRATSPDEGLAIALETFRRRAVHEVDDLTAAIARVRPDALLVDITTIGAAAVAEAQRLPWARSIPLFQHSSFAAGGSSVATMVPFGIAPSGIDVLNEPRRRVGLDPVRDADDAWRADAELYYTAPPFEDPAVDLPPSFRVVGPGLWEPGSNGVDPLRGIDGEIVLVSVSSEFQRDDALIGATLEALRDRDTTIVVTTAAHDPSRFLQDGRVRIVDWAAHGPLVRRASVVVCHAGMGITQKALAAGTPVCAVPFGRDQFEVAGRVAAAGGGTMLLPWDLSRETLRAAIDGATAMRPGAAAVAAGFAAAGGAPAAADVMESLLSDSARAEPSAAPPRSLTGAART